MLSLHAKICLFNSNVKYVLLYGADTWRTTNTTTKKLQTLLITVWEESSKFAGQTPSVTATCGKKHTYRMLEMRSEGDDGVDWSHAPETSINYHQALTWNPQRKGTPKKYAKKGSRDRHKEDRLQLEGAWKESPGQKILEDCCQWPISQEGRRVKKKT